MKKLRGIWSKKDTYFVSQSDEFKHSSMQLRKTIAVFADEP
jgi:hypothetical protein